MSERRARALRPRLDPATADYVDAAIDAAVTRLEQERLSRIDARIGELFELREAHANALAMIENQVNAEANDQARADKYVLTRAKLVRFMREAGIE